MNLHIHLVFATKYTRYVFTKQILDALKIIFPSVCNDFEADLVEFDGEKYHVHLLITYPPKVSISRSVNSLKESIEPSYSKKKYPSILSLLWGDALWAPSYFAASCGGAPISIIKQYIEQQNTPD